MDKSQITPEVGMGYTYAVGSDRYAGTITRVLIFQSGPRKGQVRGIEGKDDTARVVSGSEQDGSAQYEYERNPHAATDTFLWNEARQRFVRRGGGGGLGLGHRSFYRDPSF